jgi:uncharacterized membrane protein YphA (DoxX/SURF4 family)
MTTILNRIDRTVTCWMQRNATLLLRWSMGIIFIWFGALKLIPGMSPADNLIRETMNFLPLDYFIPFLALWEIAIGVGFIIGYGMRVTLMLLFLQMIGTLSPLFLAPHLVWSDFPVVLTLEGQYIIKNLVLVSASVAVGSKIRAEQEFDVWQAPE